MALNFSKASTQFVRNLVELGVCEDAECLNAYHPPAGIQSRSLGASQRPTSLCAAACAPSTRPVIPVDVAAWIHALDCDDFPLPEMSHQLSSSELQMSLPLEAFVDELFSNVSHRYGVQLETLVRALHLLERVQMTNIRAHNQLLLSQPSLRSGHSSNAGSYQSDEGTNGLPGTTTMTTTTWSQAPTAAPRRAHLLESAETVPPTLSMMVASPSGVARAGPSAPSGLPVVTHDARSAPVACGPSTHHRGSGLGQPARSFAHGSVFDGSSVSSGTVGPLTDAEQLSSSKCGGVRPSSLTSWCLPTKSPCEVALPASVNAVVDLPSLLGRLQLCAACAGQRVFTLQYYNVHLLLAACLALSISINEVALMDALPEDALMHQVAALSHCTDLPLQMAVRVVCETLEGELCVFDSDVDKLVHRLNIVETCVFPTEGL